MTPFLAYLCTVFGTETEITESWSRSWHWQGPSEIQFVVQPPKGQAGSPSCNRLPMTVTSQVLGISRDEDSAASLDNVFYTQVVILGFLLRWKFMCFRLFPLPLLVSVSTTDCWLSVIDYQLTLCKNNSLPHWKCISRCNSNSYELAQERQQDQFSWWSVFPADIWWTRHCRKIYKSKAGNLSF